METNIKFMYEGTLSKEKEVEIEEKSINENEEEVIIKKKQKQLDNIKILLRKPTRSLLEEGELYYTVQISKLIQAGVLTKAMLRKRVLNDKGLLSDEDNKQLLELNQKFVSNQFELSTLMQKDIKTDDDKEKIRILKIEANQLRKDIQIIESLYSALFDRTAESMAENKIILWWLLHLAYIQTGERPEPLFGEGDFIAKQTKFDTLSEESDFFYSRVIEKLTFCLTGWFNGYASKQEEFDDLIKRITEFSVEAEKTEKTSV